MRRALPLLLLLVPAALMAQAPAGRPPVPNIPGLSPAGVATLQQFQGRQNPGGPKQVQDEIAATKEMQAVLNAPTLDLDKFAAAQARLRQVAMNGRKIMDDSFVTVLKALSPADRRALIAAIPRQPQAAPAR